jgi:hypothetical protein
MLVVLGAHLAADCMEARRLKVTNPIFLAVLLACLAGCATPVPFDKMRYVGQWEGETAYLLITPQGYVRFEQYGRLLGGDLTTGMDGPLKRFDGDNFIVGIGPVATKFVVHTPPYWDGDHWKMVVGKHELARIDP